LRRICAYYRISARAKTGTEVLEQEKDILKQEINVPKQEIIP
jgi:hypothetical protein